MSDLAHFLLYSPLLDTPHLFAALVALAATLLWMAVYPALRTRQMERRLDDYLSDEEGEAGEEETTGGKRLRARSRRLLRAIGKFMPRRQLDGLQARLLAAGQPGGWSAEEYAGLELLLMGLLGAGYFLLAGPELSTATVLRNSLLCAGLGPILSRYALKRRSRRRRQEILEALPDSLDMMTIGVEAGLAFETAMLRVSQKWNNALSIELRRTVQEMRIGVPRDAALERLAERTHLPELRSVVTVLIQANHMGMSIAQALHLQADQMRINRRQRAEEQARRAGSKMVFPLVLCFMPALFIVVLGPGLPRLVDSFMR